MMRGDTLLLEEDENYVKFTKLLQKAESEGRINGQYRCGVCGMRYNEEQESKACCARVPRPL
jgi:rubrerythrin